MGEKERIRQEAKYQRKTQDPISENEAFPCNIEGTF